MTDASASAPSLSTAADHIGALLAVLAGIIFWSFWVDPAILDPGYVDWLTVDADRGVNYLGWAIFRDTPWAIPPGLNPRYGIEWSSSIVYSDSIPLLALPFKLLGGFLPRHFQYLGMWTLSCAALQGLFGYLVARRLNADVVAALVVSGFCVLAPILTFRLGHIALTGHWTILAAFFIYFGKGPTRPFSWPLLLGVVAGVHPYLFVMVLAVFGAHLVKRWLTREAGMANLAIELFASAAVSALVLWSAGAFVLSNPGAGGFGIYKLDLLGLFDSNGQFSRILPDIPNSWGAYEGFSFLGIGVLVLGLLAVPVAILSGRTIMDRRYWPIAAIALVLFLYALSNAVEIAGVTVLTIDLPGALERLAGVFRVSGRFAWLLVYLLTVAVVLLVMRRYRAMGVALAIACLAVQAFDLAPAIAVMRAQGTVLPAPPTPISGDWTALATVYSRVRALPVQHPGFEWLYASRVAAEHRLSTDSIYLARVPDMGTAKAEGDAKFSSGALDQEAVYILGPDYLAGAAMMANPGDLFGSVDNRWVFARGGCSKLPATCAAVAANAAGQSLKLLKLTLGSAGEISAAVVRAGNLAESAAAICGAGNALAGLPGSEQGPSASYRPLAAGIGIVSGPATCAFSVPASLSLSADAANAPWLVSGWSVRETRGVWTTANSAQLQIALNERRDHAINVVLTGHAFVSEQHREQRVSASVGARIVDHWVVTFPDPNFRREIRLEPEEVASGDINLQFDLPDIASPASLGLSADTRTLGIHLVQIELASDN